MGHKRTQGVLSVCIWETNQVRSCLIKILWGKAWKDISQEATLVALKKKLNLNLRHGLILWPISPRLVQLKNFKSFVSQCSCLGPFRPAAADSQESPDLCGKGMSGQCFVELSLATGTADTTSTLLWARALTHRFAGRLQTEGWTSPVPLNRLIRSTIWR